MSSSKRLHTDASTLAPSERGHIEASPDLPPRSAVELVAGWLQHPRLGSTIALGFATLLIAAALVPQDLAPWPVADGWSRPDLQALRAFGLTRIARSVPWLVLSVVLVLAVLARLVQPRSTGSDVPADVAAVGRRLAAFGPARMSRQGPEWIVEVGQASVGRWLLLAGGMVAIVAATLQGAQPATVWIDVELGAPSRTFAAQTADAGRLAPAAGRWAGQCQGQGDALSCELDTPRGAATVQLSPGRSADLPQGRATWIATASGSGAAAMSMQWPGPSGDWRVPLAAGEMAEVPEIHAQVLADVLRSGGPMALTLVGESGKRELQLLVGPHVLPFDAANRRDFSGGTQVRLALDAANVAPAWVALALALLVVGLLLRWGLPSAQLRIGTEIYLESCNRRALLLAVQGPASGPVGAP